MKQSMACHRCESEFVIECDETVKHCPVCGGDSSELEELYGASNEEVWD